MVADAIGVDDKLVGKLKKSHLDMYETKRLIIKPLSCDELKKHINSPNELAKDLGLIPSQILIDKETQEAILNDLLPNIEDSNKDSLFYTIWVMIEKSKKAIIGGFCFHGEPNENGEIEIGYGTDDEYRNQGYMTETIAGLVLWIRNNKNVKIIKAETDNGNISSVRVLEKNGFKICSRNDNSVILGLGLK
jgi:[ribosomal protein S5]-alanine N-acetyltransferase